MNLINEDREYNYSLLASKGLCDNNVLNQKYYILLRNYKFLLEKYLKIKLNLEDYDNRLTNSGLNFAVVNADDMDYYQKSSFMELKYIYLRNDIYVEHLSTDDINVLLNVDFSKITSLDDEIFKLIERTYRNVIDSSNGSITQMNCYGRDSDYFWKRSDELVFGVRYDHFAPHNLSDEEWRNNYYQKESFLYFLIEEMDKKSSDILDFNVNFLQYDKYTVNRVKSK